MLGNISAMIQAKKAGGWLVLCSGLAFSGCAPLELGFSCASLGKKSVLYTLRSVKKCIIWSV